MTKKSKVYFELEHPIDNGDKCIEIIGQYLRIWIDFDDRTVKTDKIIRKNVNKMLGILNKHWDDK